MPCLSGTYEVYMHIYFFPLSIAHFVFLLMFCEGGKAGIAVFDGITEIAEFPDLELPYTQTVKRNGIEGSLVAANPLHACVNISAPPDMKKALNWFVLIAGNSCSFETKVINAELAGYSVAIIYTHRGRVERFNNQHGHHRFYSDMPAIVIKTEDGIILKENYLYSVSTIFRLVIFPNNTFSIMTFLLLFSIVAGLFLVIMLIFTVIRFFQQTHATHNGRLSSQHLKQLQTTTFQKGDGYETCAICLEDYKDKDVLRVLPCSHGYHTKCIDPWLTNNRRICPVCKRKVVLTGENINISSSNFEETTPLLQTQRIASEGTFSYVNDPVVNPNHNLARSHMITRNMQSTSVTMPPTERSQDRQHVLNYLQL